MKRSVKESGKELASGVLVSIQTGKVQRHVMPENVRVDFRHPFWTSGIYKSGVSGAVQVTRAGIEGDQQADLENHGGPDNVVLAYDAEHYPFWREDLGMPELTYGSFGENFTVTGFSDETVCIGDVWQVGATLMLQVTQARQPCYKLARRLRQPHIVKKIHDNSWGGWYLRVLAPGPAEAGMAIERVKRLHAEWPVAKAIQVLYRKGEQAEAAAELAALPELSARWKAHLMED
jgi:MOSC domain-containing protein YiiM